MQNRPKACDNNVQVRWLASLFPINSGPMLCDFQAWFLATAGYLCTEVCTVASTIDCTEELVYAYWERTGFHINVNCTVI